MNATTTHKLATNIADEAASVALTAVDPLVARSLRRELERQRNQIELIASENFASPAVMEAQGCVMTNKYAEGYPGRRYYGGCEFVDEVEVLAQTRARDLFHCAYANVQPHSGSQANQAVMQALLKPGDTILGMSLAAGGHLTHGATPNQSGKWFQAIQYGVRKDNHLLDMDEVAKLAEQHKPKLIIAGCSAYARQIDFAAFRQIADALGAYLLVDMAHIAGLVVAGMHPSPLPYADVVTTTTHKTLRGPRGGLILAQTDELAKKFNSAIFPGLQGGPLMHIIAAKAVAFHEAQQPDFKTYIQAVCTNAKILAQTLQKEGLDIVSGGTDNHLCLVDLRPKNYTGKDAEAVLELVNITCNKNAIPFDPKPPMVTSGLRLGSAAMTTRGFGEKEFAQIGHWIAQALGGQTQDMRKDVTALCAQFPLYPS